MEAFELGKVINLAAVQPQKEKKASDGEAILGRDAFDFEAGKEVYACSGHVNFCRAG
jgi:hypothetical protein